MLIIRDFGNRFQEISGMPLSSSAAKQKMKQAGIESNSKQYKAAIGQMMKAAKGGVGYTTIGCIKTRMRQFDRDGDRINSETGLAGLEITDQNRAFKDRMIAIPESSKEEMFQNVKREFIRECGVLNGNTTKRSEVFTNLYRKMEKKNRLAAGYTLEQYERKYRMAFIKEAKAADPGWEIGQPVKYGALENITRDMVESASAGRVNKGGEGTLDIKI